MRSIGFLKDHPVKEKPVVTFAGNYGSVDRLHDALAKAGHRVAVLDGRKSTKEKDLARRQFLADVETELRHIDAAEDQIDEHAADAHDTLTAEIAKQARSLEPEGNDPDTEAQWRYMLGQRHRAQRVRAVAEDAKSRR